MQGIVLPWILPGLCPPNRSYIIGSKMLIAKCFVLIHGSLRITPGNAGGDCGSGLATDRITDPLIDI